MASTSSSSAEVYAYDVFVSFRGEDTRNSFTDHLYHGLKRAGICTFRDTEEINRGEELQPEIERAIKSSRASIVVLSENYATSTWCLDELMLILEQKKQTEGSHSVVPVFYHVDPSDVRKQIGSFDIKVKASTRWTDEKVCLWKTALTEVANLSGFTLSGPETIILKEIVETVYDKLDRKEVHLPLNITGMTSRYKEIESWIDGGIPEFLAIYGMGGSGKTTLAKHIFNLNRRTFEYVSFIEDIGTRCNEPSGLLQLQEQLLKDILGGKKRKISSVSRGTCMIGDALQMNRTLIVLDDILEHNQLVALLGTRKINAQSKVIITTRKNIDNWFDLSCHRCQKYEMKLLNDDESLELLSRHAFRSKIPNEGSMSLLLEATRLCEGNPLALEVLGSSLLTNDATYWESMLKLFGKDIDSRIEGVLKRSYESLPCNTVKQLFLHIACFFTGIDMDYVVKILDPDYSARSGIKTLINRCLLSVSPNKTLMMHRLLQEMGKNIVRQESTNLPARRSRVWLSCDSHKILSKGKGSETIEGLALDMRMLRKEHSSSTSSELKTDALKNMDNLKLLKLNYVELNGSYEKFSEDLKWLCWLGFHSRTIPVDLYMGNLVAIDMSYSNLEVFEPPMDIHTLKILNLKDSYKLIEILNIFRIPNLETLILWNCFGLVNVCKTIEGLTSLTLLNMSGCENLFRGVNLSAASSSGAVVTEQPNFSFPFSLNRLFLNDCHLECTDSFPLSFSVQPVLQYLNLGNSLFESLPCYNHLENLRVLDLSNCSRLRCLVRLPNTLAELYVCYCELLEKITFQSPRFTLQEFGYEGCINLYEVEGFIKLLPVAKLDETDLGHMNWLKVYQNHEMCLGGDDELTVGRSWHIQMLYEFNIMSTSLPNIKDPNMTPKYISKSSSLSFDVPWCPKNKRLKGINVTFKYTISGEDWVWFCKINTRNGVDLIYNPRVFGKPEFGKECIWLSYWPIGNKLSVGDTVHVSVVVFNGLEVHECGVSMVYSDEETLEDNMGWEEIIGGDLSGFQLSTGAYYLCRNDFFELMEVGRVTPDWFRILVGHTINYTEVRGWRKTGRPKQVNRSFTELRTIRCIIHGPQQEDIYNIAEMSKSSNVDKSLAFTSTLLEEEMKSIARSDETMGEIYAKQEIKSGLETVGDFISTLDKITIKESDPHSHKNDKDNPKMLLEDIKQATQNFNNDNCIGGGGFGRVYKGNLQDGDGFKTIVAKRLDSRFGQGEQQFLSELQILLDFKHESVIGLVGFCDENDEKIIIYEYASKGSLDRYLNDASLTWEKRLDICIDVARALDFLHGGVGKQAKVIHRDIKTANILLNDDWKAKLADFGLSLVSPLVKETDYVIDHVCGTTGYLDPLYRKSGFLTIESDIYSFGVVLFEILCGRSTFEIQKHEGHYLPDFIEKSFKEGKHGEVVFKQIREQIVPKSLITFQEIAYQCLHLDREKRPTTKKVLMQLKKALVFQNMASTMNQFAHLQIPLEAVAKATNNFHHDNIIKHGGVGIAYKGRLLWSGRLTEISARRFDCKHGDGDLEFLAEISALSDLKHKNLVSIIGFCDEIDEKIIVTTYEANGSLGQYLNSLNLTWKQRLRICLGVARALSYLHYDKGRDYAILHCNINSNTILLNDNWETKLSGFEFSIKQSVNDKDQVCPCEHTGTLGCVDPAIEKTRGVTHKSDIYSFGVVLFEILCGRKAFIQNETDRSLAQMAKYCYENGTLHDMIHPQLLNQILSPQSLLIYSKVAYSCLNEDRADRPNMHYVMAKLKKALELQLRGENIENKLGQLKIHLNDIKSATNNFSEAYTIASRSAGYTLYRAELHCFDKENLSCQKGKYEGERLKGQSTVVLKRYPSGHALYGEEKFFTEIEVLTLVKHPNIVNLLGFCVEDSEMVLVTENISNGYLVDYFRNVNHMRILTWEKRLKICIDVAHALNYLHYEMEDQKIIINREINSLSIGLAENWGAKIVNFWWSVFLPSNHEALYLTNCIGRPSYKDPQYEKTGRLKRETDIYSFGVVLFEILCGRGSGDPIYRKENVRGLGPLARQSFCMGTIEDMIDPILKEEIGENNFILSRGPNKDSLHTFMKIAYECVAETQDQRPTMKVVVKELEKALSFQVNGNARKNKKGSGGFVVGKKKVKTRIPLAKSS